MLMPTFLPPPHPPAPPERFLQALQAECVAVRSLGSNVEAANQTLVDSMCDMSGESA